MVSLNKLSLISVRRLRDYGPRFSYYATAVWLAFGSPGDEGVLCGYVGCDLLNNTSPGLGLIV